MAKFQIGLFGKVKYFQNELDRFALRADTDDMAELCNILTDMSLLLNRNIEYVSYGATAFVLVDDLDEAERKFNQASLKERSKFRSETLTNYDGITQTRSNLERGTGNGLDEWLCVTVLVAVDAQLKLPKIRSLSDVKEALNMLGSVREDELLAMELLWTPQAEGDSYSKDEMLQDYPQLMSV